MSTDAAYLISVPYNPSSPSPKPIKYSPYPEPIGDYQIKGSKIPFIPNSTVVESVTSLGESIKHVFPLDQGFDPVRIEVNGRKNRRTCIAIGSDSKSFYILDLEYSEDDATESRAAEAVLGVDRQGST